MDYIFSEWETVKARLGAGNIFLFLDYDGTIAPIAGRPEQAVLPQEARRLLKRLSEAPHVKLAIISGRSLECIKHKVGIKGLIYAGNHGMEIEGPKLKFAYPVSPEYKSALMEIKNKLDNEVCHLKGAFVEDKGVGISLHYRQAGQKQAKKAKTIFHEIILPYKKAKLVKVRPGKMVMEVRPLVKWDKGEAVLWLLARQQFAVGDKKLVPIYIGDDKTDEDAFVAIKDKGPSIFTGAPAISNADYYLKDNRDVMKFLNLILKEFGKNAGISKSQRAL